MEAVSCQLCSLLSPNLRGHISHLRQVHSEDPGFSLVCGIQECSQRFTTFGAFNSHVYRVHRSSLGLDTTTLSVDLLDDDDHSIPTGTTSETAMCPAYRFDDHIATPEDLQYDIGHLLGVNKEQQQKEAATFLLKLKEVCNVSERTIGDIITGCRSLVANSLAVVKASVKDSLGNAGMSISDIDGLNEAFTNVPDVFQGLETTYMQDKYFRDHFNFLVRRHPACMS